MAVVMSPPYWLLQVARATTGTETLSSEAGMLPPSEVVPQPATVVVLPEAGSEPEAGRAT
jgi:hypothetical protein